MKKQNVTRADHNVQTFLLAAAFLALVMFISYLQWFA